MSQSHFSFEVALFDRSTTAYQVTRLLHLLLTTIILTVTFRLYSLTLSYVWLDLSLVLSTSIISANLF